MLSQMRPTRGRRAADAAADYEPAFTRIRSMLQSCTRNM